MLGAWRSLVPANVPVATGISSEDYYFDDDAFPTRAIGDFITVHADRAEGDNGWRTVRHSRELGDIASKFGKPVVSDEPIGADETNQPGRRTADPAKHFGLAFIPRIADIAGVTFHYEGGLRYDIPAGNQLTCFHAWHFGATVVPELTVLTYQNANINGGWSGSPVASFNFSTDGASNTALRAYSGIVGATDTSYTLVVGKVGDPQITWQNGWQPGPRVEYYPGIEVIALARNGQAAPALPKNPHPAPAGPTTVTCNGGSYANMQNGWATKAECEKKVSEAGVTKTCVLVSGCYTAQ
jgi:hypothetical protein